MVATHVLALIALLATTTTSADNNETSPIDAWIAGDHATGDWWGARSWLSDHGVTIDAAYAAEVFTDVNAAIANENGTTLLGHVDAAITLDTGGLGFWPGGKLYALAQNSHGTGINTVVHSASAISNLEADPYTQLTELFYEQSILDVVRVRIGKQDANRDFGTPRFGGNFINNNFGMLPTVPLPSYPTTGLGAFAAVDASWLTLKAGVYERDPQVESLGIPQAFAPNAGYSAAGAVDVRHTLGPQTKNGGTTTAGAWHQGGTITAPDGKQFGDGNDGVFFQNDERIYVDPNPKHDDPAGITFIVRAAFARPDRNAITSYAGGSIAWHGLFGRDDDTTGVGIGWFALNPAATNTPSTTTTSTTATTIAFQSTNAHSELFAEAFYKLRLTKFFSLQPDVMYIAHPNGNQRDAFLAGLRMKVKL